MGGKITASRRHPYNVSTSQVERELGRSTHAVIKFPERVQIVDIISDIRNIALADLEVIVSRPPANKAIGVVVIEEYASKPILFAQSKRLNHRTVSQQVLSPVIETIGQKAIAPHIAIEILPLPDIPQFQGLCNLKLAHKETIYLQSLTQIKQSEKTKIRIASATMLQQPAGPEIGSKANLLVNPESHESQCPGS